MADIDEQEFSFDGSMPDLFGRSAGPGMVNIDDARRLGPAGVPLMIGSSLIESLSARGVQDGDTTLTAPGLPLPARRGGAAAASSPVPVAAGKPAGSPAVGSTEPSPAAAAAKPPGRAAAYPDAKPAEKAGTAKKKEEKPWQSRESDLIPDLGKTFFGSFGMLTIPTTSALFGGEEPDDEVHPLVREAEQGQTTEVLKWIPRSAEDDKKEKDKKTRAQATTKIAAAKAAAAAADAAPDSAELLEAAKNAAEESKAAETVLAGLDKKPEASARTDKATAPDAARLADTVSRNLYRRLQLERERKGIPACKN